jgi:sodium/potassium-transporting ATPase subunit alpha
LVLLENFSAIIKGIELGRLVFDNLKKVIAVRRRALRSCGYLRSAAQYLLPAGSFSELWPVLVSVVFGLPQPLSSLQMISARRASISGNLCLTARTVICVGTDVFPALTMVYEGPEADLLSRPPRNLKRDRLASPQLLCHAYLFIGASALGRERKRAASHLAQASSRVRHARSPGVDWT